MKLMLFCLLAFFHLAAFAQNDNGGKCCSPAYFDQPDPTYTNEEILVMKANPEKYFNHLEDLAKTTFSEYGKYLAQCNDKSEVVKIKNFTQLIEEFTTQQLVIQKSTRNSVEKDKHKKEDSQGDCKQDPSPALSEPKPNCQYSKVLKKASRWFLEHPVMSQYMEHLIKKKQLKQENVESVKFVLGKLSLENK